jgi:hypothetical protein
MAMNNTAVSVPSPPAGEQELDDVLSALSNHRRRYVLSDLVRHFHPVPLYDLVDRLACWERGESVTGETRRLIREDLTENHIPPMVDLGLIEFSPEDERLTLTVDGMRAERVRRKCSEALEEPFDAQ